MPAMRIVRLADVMHLPRSFYRVLGIIAKIFALCEWARALSTRLRAGVVLARNSFYSMPPFFALKKLERPLLVAGLVGQFKWSARGRSGSSRTSEIAYHSQGFAQNIRQIHISPNKSRFACLIWRYYQNHHVHFVTSASHFL